MGLLDGTLIVELSFKPVGSVPPPTEKVGLGSPVAVNLNEYGWPAMAVGGAWVADRTGAKRSSIVSVASYGLARLPPLALERLRLSAIVFADIRRRRRDSEYLEAAAFGEMQGALGHRVVAAGVSSAGLQFRLTSAE